MKIIKTSGKSIFLLMSFVVLYIPFTTFGQNVYGLSGFVKIPDAEINDGHFSAGIFLINNNQVFNIKFNDDKLESKYTFVYYASVGFLPFFEVSFRGYKIGSPGEALGDRMFNMKLKFLSEDPNFIPNISIGINDLVKTQEVETQNFNSTYIVFSKNFEAFIPIKIVLGYGIKLFNAAAFDLLGFWYGMGIIPFTSSRITIEYDSKDVNMGIEYKVFDTFKFSLAYFRLKYAGIGMSLELKL